MSKFKPWKHRSTSFCVHPWSHLAIEPNGNVIPCCHLNSKMLEYSVTGQQKDRFELILENQDYMTDINLKNVSIEQAMNGKVWLDIQRSWKEENKIKKCVTTCQMNKKDKFIKEKL